MKSKLKLDWERYDLLTSARDDFPDVPCVYIQTDKPRKPKRVGKASKGLNARYRGGTGYALDAAMHESGNLVYVASVPSKSCAKVEAELVWQGRNVLIYNMQGKKVPSKKRIDTGAITKRVGSLSCTSNFTATPEGG